MPYWECYRQTEQNHPCNLLIIKIFCFLKMLSKCYSRFRTLFVSCVLKSINGLHAIYRKSLLKKILWKWHWYLPFSVPTTACKKPLSEWLKDKQILYSHCLQRQNQWCKFSPSHLSQILFALSLLFLFLCCFISSITLRNTSRKVRTSGCVDHHVSIKQCIDLH